MIARTPSGLRNRANSWRVLKIGTSVTRMSNCSLKLWAEFKGGSKTATFFFGSLHTRLCLFVRSVVHGNVEAFLSDIECKVLQSQTPLLKPLAAEICGLTNACKDFHLSHDGQANQPNLRSHCCLLPVDAICQSMQIDCCRAVAQQVCMHTVGSSLLLLPLLRSIGICTVSDLSEACFVVCAVHEQLVQGKCVYGNVGR